MYVILYVIVYLYVYKITYTEVKTKQLRLSGTATAESRIIEKPGCH
jgi:hypothetical protein